MMRTHLARRVTVSALSAFALVSYAGAETKKNSLVTTPLPNSAEALFAKYNSDGNEVLDEGELTHYVIDWNPTYSKAVFKELYRTDQKYREAVNGEARKEAQGIAQKFGWSDPTNPELFVLGLPQFRNYLEGQGKTKKEKVDVLKTLTGSLSDKHLHISKSVAVNQGANAGGVEPARFAWTKGATGDPVFTIDAALSYSFTLSSVRFDGVGSGQFFLQPTVEAHTSTNPKAQQDSISAKIPLQFVFNPVNREPIASHYLSISPVYETDHSKATEAYGGEIFYSPTIPDLYIGSLQSFRGLPEWITFGWRPYIGLEGGEATQPAPKTGYKLPPEFMRFAFKLHSDLYFSNRFDLAVDFCHRTFFYGDDATFDYVEISPLVYLDEDQHLSLGVTYKNGYTSPQFGWVRSIGAWVGIKF